MIAREEVGSEDPEHAGFASDRDLVAGLTVHEMLLGFAGLSQKDRDNFLSSLNEFLVCSPQRRRKVVAAWRGLCDSQTDL